MKNTKLRNIPKKKIVIYAAYGVLILLFLLAMIFIIKLRSNDEVGTIVDDKLSTEAEFPESDINIEKPDIVIEEDAEPVMIEWMAELYTHNPDVVAWIEIEDTKLDYPVMFTPDDEEKYIYKNFEGNYDLSGLPFIDKDCSVEPESDNIIIYGHNMNNGESFKTIMSYTEQEFWEAHPTIKYTTLYEERTYEIVAAFYDKVYYKSDTCFKFYQFIDADDEENFNEAMTYFAENSCIDTGITPEYGDNFIMLVTCSYHVDNGRFVLVARQVTDTADDNNINIDQQVYSNVNNECKLNKQLKICSVLSEDRTDFQHIAKTLDFKGVH